VDKHPTEKTQRQKFIEAARKAEADESESAFEAKLKKIAKAKPQPDRGDKK
jgi:hypothetical protein